MSVVKESCCCGAAFEADYDTYLAGDSAGSQTGRVQGVARPLPQSMDGPTRSPVPYVWRPLINRRTLIPVLTVAALLAGGRTVVESAPGDTPSPTAYGRGDAAVSVMPAGPGADQSRRPSPLRRERRNVSGGKGEALGLFALLPANTKGGDAHAAHPRTGAVHASRARLASPGGRELHRLINQVNQCRADLGLPPLTASARAWRGDRYDQWRVNRWRALRDAWCSVRDHARGDAMLAIRIVFRSHAREAITVARCESGGTFSPHARNGQYEGIFQMGRSERARFGHGDNVLDQTLAAHRYWRQAGWRPWQCSPRGGLQW